MSSSTERFFCSIKEFRVLAESWRVYYNTVRPHSSLGYKPPAPEAWLTATSKAVWRNGNHFAFPTSPHRNTCYLSTTITALHQLITISKNRAIQFLAFIEGEDGAMVPAEIDWVPAHLSD
jgi:hypothetical protein